MRLKVMTIALFLTAGNAFSGFGGGEDGEVPPIDDQPPPVVVVNPLPAPAAYPNDMPHQGYPVQEPPFPVVNRPLPKRVPWTTGGAQGLVSYGQSFCFNADSPYNCVHVTRLPASPYYDWGYRIYRRDNGAYLGTVDRNVTEEVLNDYNQIVQRAEEHHPESAWIARQEARKAQLEYMAAACVSGGVYCSAMAAKLPSWKELMKLACSGWSGVCISQLTKMKEDIQKRIDEVKKQCAKDDQACFDAVTNGGETDARRLREAERGGGGLIPGEHSGERPPHSVHPMVFGDGDPMEWYDSSCKHCKVYDGKDPNNY